MYDVHTVVVARKIQRGRESDYERWAGKVVTALHHTPGYDGMTAISSPDQQGSVRTLLIRFRTAEALSGWEDSAVRQSLSEAGDQFFGDLLPCRGGSRGLFLHAWNVSSSVSLENVLADNPNGLPAV